MVTTVVNKRKTEAGSTASTIARPMAVAAKIPAHSQVTPRKKRSRPGCAADGWRSATTSAASFATSGLPVGAVLANRAHRARFATGN